MSRQYKVLLTELYPATQHDTYYYDWDNLDGHNSYSSDSDSDFDKSDRNANDDEEEDEGIPNENVANLPQQDHRPRRIRQPPPYLGDYET